MFIEVGKKDRLGGTDFTTFIGMLNNLIDSRQTDIARKFNEKIYSVRFEDLVDKR